MHISMPIGLGSHGAHAILAYYALASAAGHGVAKAPVANLARLCSLSVRSTQAALHTLADAGLVVIEPQAEPSGRRLANLYWIVG